jgi:Ni,Fe-hydrogenase III small subunit
VPGCAAKPESILNGVLRAAKLLKVKEKAMRKRRREARREARLEAARTKRSKK